MINGDFFNHSDYDGKDILEIGCGLGADLQKFAESGSKVFAIDAAPSSYNSLCRRFELINKEFKFEVADFRSLPFEESKFDLIYDHKLRIDEKKRNEIVKRLEQKSNEK